MLIQRCNVRMYAYPPEDFESLAALNISMPVRDFRDQLHRCLLILPHQSFPHSFSFFTRLYFVLLSLTPS